MAKKYKNAETKVHPITIGAILLFVVSMITLILVLQPKPETTLTEKYLAAGANSSLADEKYALSKDNNLVVNNHLNNQWFGLKKGIFHEIEKDELTLILFANPDNAASASAIAYVHYYLYTNPSTKALGESVKNLIHYSVSSGTGKNSMGKVLEKITEKLELEEDELVATEMPVLVAFKNGKVVESLTTGLTPNSIRDFYLELLK
ncbi:MAG: hypothetical protein GX312_05415 [Candidatus Phytoplasma sp.]|nr:hypothetical protein [Phytoplasma sp.]